MHHMIISLHTQIMILRIKGDFAHHGAVKEWLGYK